MTQPPPLPPANESPGKGGGLSEDARELLGMGKDDWWCYVGWVPLAAGCFLRNPWAVLALFAVSCVFVGIYLARSYPRFYRGEGLSPGVRIYCLLANVFVIALQVVVIAVKCWFLTRG